MRAGLTARHEFCYLDQILVECLACGGRAEARAVGERLRGARRITCTRCLNVRTMARPVNVIRSPVVESLLPGYQLWLRGRTRHGTLYAYNHEHLNYLAAYIAASLRQVDFSATSIRNSSVTSRLPSWVKSAKNRAEVLKAIERMRRK